MADHSPDPWGSSVSDNPLTNPTSRLQVTSRDTPLPSHTTEEWQRFLAPAEGPGEIGRLGGYRVLRVLGAGGMGIVFQAEDPQLHRAVALKIMKPSVAINTEARQRFLREARSTAAIRDDHVVTIYQVGEDRDVPFLAMEFLEGETLEERLRGSEGAPSGLRLSLPEILRIGREIAEGLAAAHSCGLIHRDVKPSNIWLDKREGRVELVDFGLARAHQEDVQLTQAGMVVGTPAYMSPEQAQSDAIDPRSDLFSLGCVLYLLCTGRLPFHGETTFETLLAVTSEAPPVISGLAPECPAPLIELVERLLAKKPDDRPATAREVVDALSALEGPGPDKTEMMVPAAPRKRKGGRGRVLVAGLVGVALAAAVMVAATLIQGPAAKTQLRLDLTPEDALATLDDQPLSAGAARDGLAITPGHHRLVVRKAGSVPVTEELDVPAGQVITRPIKLTAIVTNEWVKEVSELRGALQLRRTKEMLKALNPSFDPDKVKEEYTKEVQPGVHFIRSFSVANDAVMDLSPIQALTNLKQLDCVGTGKGKLTDLAPLRGLKLRRLNVRGNPVTDLAPLEQLPELQELEIDAAPGQDLEVLRRMRKTGSLKTINGQSVATFLGEK